MASLQIEVASSSSPFSYSLRDHNRSTATNITGYIHNQCIRSKNNADDDDSWLPTGSQNSTVTSESEASHHRKEQNDVDDSWLPATNDTAGKHGTKSSESDNDFDYSWLPSTFTENKHKNETVNHKNKNKVKNKKNNSNNNGGMQKKSGNDHWALAREVVFSCDQQIQNTELSKKTSDSSRKKDSPSKSRYTVESPTSGGVSSLLQRWRDLAEAKNSNKNGNVSPLSKRNNSGSSCKDNKNITENNNSSETDWESDKTSCSRRLSCPLPSRESRETKDSNTVDAEKEKIRVVDIIKKLSKDEELAASSSAKNGNELLPPIRTSRDHRQIEGEQKRFKGVKVSRHLIRGRQAFNNFLMQMEHDKLRELKWLVERKSVSKFSHRGRIQALLRFRILRLGAEPNPEVKTHRRCISKTLESNNRLDIMDLRERFNSGVEKGTSESRKDKRNSIKKTANDQESFSTPKAAKDSDIESKISSKKEEPRSKPDQTAQNQSTSSCQDAVHKAKNVDSSSKNTRYKNEDKYDFHEDEGQFMSAKTSYSHIEDKGLSDLEDMSYTNKKPALESFEEDWMTNEYSQTHSELDEDESYDMEIFDNNYDWISDISRPKSDWEDMRKARYQEMLKRSSGNTDIRRLLERKNVSSFLSSSLRDVIDQLMMTRIQQSNVHVEKQEVVAREKGEPKKEEVGQEDGSTVDEDGKTDRPCSEYSDYVDQTLYSERSWRPNDGVYNSETTTITTTTTTSPSLERSPLSNRSRNNSTPQSSPPVAHPSIEMELIYDLRGHMEQLHQEIMELRKSIKCCVNMQVKMQRSFKQNVVVAAPATRSVEKNERKPLGVVKHDCSICGDMQVDSLLYRCGHMCTCFKCAVELQRTSAECPVCEALIVDVVKAFAQ